MNCPKCGGEQHCPCSSCVPRHKQKTTWIMKDENGMEIACGHCGYTTDWQSWNDLSLEQQGEKRDATI